MAKINEEIIIDSSKMSPFIKKGETKILGGVSIKTKYLGRDSARIEMGGDKIISDVRMNDIVSSSGKHFLVTSVSQEKGVQLRELESGFSYCTTTSGRRTAAHTLGF